MDMTWNHNFSEEMTKKQVHLQEIPGNSAWGLSQSQHGSQTPLLHTSSSSSSVRSCFRSNFHEPAANRLLQNVRCHCIMHCIMHIMHIMHHIASYWIILDHRKTSVDSPRVPKANQGRLHTTQITSDLAALEPVRDSLQDSPGTLSETPSSFHVA